MSDADNLLRWVYCTQHIAHMTDAHQASFRRKESAISLQIQFTCLIHRHYFNHNTFSLT